MALGDRGARVGLQRVSRSRRSRKNEQDHVCVLNSVARSIIERCRGKHRPRCSPIAASRCRASTIRPGSKRASARRPSTRSDWVNLRRMVSERCTCTTCGTRSGALASGGCCPENAAGHPRPQEREHHHALLSGGVTRARRCDGIRRTDNARESHALILLRERRVKDAPSHVFDGVG